MNKDLISTVTPPATKDRPDVDTKERLLEAGIEIFAERGFADTSIRQICAHAGANAAAVNYHFGDKAAFYAEVLATCHLRAVKRRPMPKLDDDPEHPEAVLRTWIRWFLELLMVDGDGPLGRLMAREMADPTPALDQLILRSMLPMMRRLGKILRAVLPDASEATLRLCHNSLLGQLLFYKHSQAAIAGIQRLAARGELDDDSWTPAPPLAPTSLAGPDATGASFPDLDRLADHIFQFSLAGFLAVADDSKVSP